MFAQALQVLELIKLLNVNCKDFLVTDMYLLLPKVLQLIEYKRLQDISVSIKAVNTIGEFHISILNNHLYIIIPMLLRICSNGVAPEEIKLNIEVLKTFNTLKGCQSFREHMGQIIHQLLQIMETHINQQTYVQGILDLITSIAEKLTLDFAPYIPLVQKAIRRNKLSYDRFDEKVERIITINPITLFVENMEASILEEQKEIIFQASNSTSQHLTSASHSSTV